MVYICNPNNPTGNVHTIEYIESLLGLFPDTLFLIDEAYYEFSGQSAKDLVLRYDNILISRTMSKAFALDLHTQIKDLIISHLESLDKDEKTSVLPITDKSSP